MIKVGDTVKTTNSWDNRDDGKWRQSYINKPGKGVMKKKILIRMNPDEYNTTYSVEFVDGNILDFSENEIGRI